MHLKKLSMYVLQKCIMIVTNHLEYRLVQPLSWHERLQLELLHSCIIYKGGLRVLPTITSMGLHESIKTFFKKFFQCNPESIYDLD